LDRGAEVAARRSPQNFPERGDERAGRAVAGFQSGVRNLLPGGQQLQRAQQAELLPPFPQRQVRLELEYPLDGPLARARPLADRFQRTLFARIALQGLGDPDRPGVRRSWKL